MILGALSFLYFLITVIFKKTYQFILHFRAKIYSYKYILVTLSIQMLECLVMCFKYFLAGNLDNIFYVLVLYLITIIATSIYIFFFVELLKITDKRLPVQILGSIIIILNIAYLVVLIVSAIAMKTFYDTGHINCKDSIFIVIAINGLLISIFLIILTVVVTIEFRALQSNPNYDSKKVRKLW